MGYPSITEVIAVKEYLRNQLDPGPTEGERWRFAAGREVLQQERAAGKQLWDQRKEIMSLAVGSTKETLAKQWQGDLETIKDPAMRKYADTIMKGTLVDPIESKLYYYDKYNKKPEFPDTSGMSEEGRSLAEGQYFKTVWEIDRGRKIIEGRDPGPVPRMLLNNDTILYTDDKNITRTVSMQHFKIEEAIKAMGSTDVPEAVINRGGIVHSARLGQFVGNDGELYYTYETYDVATGRKGIAKDAVGTPMPTKGKKTGTGELGTKAANELAEHMQVWSLSEIGIDNEYEGAAKQTVNAVFTLQKGLDEAAKTFEDKQRMVSDYYEKGFPGVVATLVDTKKFQKKGVFASFFGPDVEYSEGSKYGILAIVRGERVKAPTKGGQDIEGVLGANNQFYDKNLQGTGLTFDSAAKFREWASEIDAGELKQGMKESPELDVLATTVEQVTGMSKNDFLSSTPLMIKWRSGGYDMIDLVHDLGRIYGWTAWTVNQIINGATSAIGESGKALKAGKGDE